MDTRRLLTTLMIGLVLFFGMQIIMPLIFPAKNAPPSTAPTTQGAGAIGVETTQPQKVEGAVANADVIVLGNAESGSKDKLAIQVNAVTAGIDWVKLNADDYSEGIKEKKPLTLLSAREGAPRPFSTLGAHVKMKDGREVWIDGANQTPEGNSVVFYRYQVPWRIVNKSATEVSLAWTILDKQDPKQPVAEITKTFKIDPDSYEITVSHRVKNLTNEPITVAIDQMGPTDLPRDNAQIDDRFFHGAKLVTEKLYVEANGWNFTQGQMPKHATRSESIGQMIDFGPTKDPTLWIGASNRFFCAIARPVGTDASKTFKLADGRELVGQNHVDRADLDILVQTESDPSACYAGVRFTGAAVPVAEGKDADMPLKVFLGPKKRDLLAGNRAAAPGTRDYERDLYHYSSIIQLASGCYCYSFCTFEWLADAILWFLDFLKRTIAFGNYGVAIMLLVIIVRACLHPLTRVSQIQMATMSKKMREIQPKLTAIKKKYEKDRQKLNQETLRIYQENNVNPAGGVLGCLPMLIQMPIWVALYNGLRVDIDLRHAPFVPGWISDLSNPDTIYGKDVSDPAVIGHPFFHFPLLGDVYGLNLLPILLAVVFIVQMRVQLAQQPPAQDEQQARMQKLPMYMIFLFPLFLYGAPSGLNLYIFASTMAGLVDTYIIRKSLKKRGILPANAQNLPTHEERD